MGEKCTQITLKRVNIQKLTAKGMNKTMFVHNYYHSLDAKNRLFMPVRFRDQLGERIYIIPGPDASLFVYSEEQFNIIAEQYREKNRDLNKQMAFFSNVCETTADNQGRVTLNADHVKHAELKKEVAVIGAGKRVVIMPLEKFKIAETDTNNAIDYSTDIDW